MSVDREGLLNAV